ncbi:hypothetical protein [Bacillus sp. B15-48]|uniref:hypothetical protein n=1 Tax=Bacillus sp. B15-48 TaxID=1548601 RepID=UPI001940133E|nr:hypothetical protein [Bacillus sp. B15-48]MBM4762755.1 hypothetical protein [Bacillus sp. B15-48]
MELERQKVLLLATSLKNFVHFVHDRFHKKFESISNKEKLIRLKLLVEEYQFKTIANELLRLNKVSFDEHQTRLLIARFIDSFRHVVDFFEHNKSELFIFSGRIYTIDDYCHLLTSEDHFKETSKEAE